MKKILVFFLLLAMTLCAAVANASGLKPMVILAATSNPPGSSHEVAITKFKELIEKESDGVIRVQPFIGGTMGSEQANVKQLRTGELHVSALSADNMTPFAPSATLLVLPGLFPSIDKAHKLLGDDRFLTDLGDRIARESSTRPIGWLISGYRNITNSKHPVTCLDDLKDLKIRVPAVDLQLATYKAWGTEGFPMAWSETFNALQQGVADGQYNPHLSTRDRKFWEVQKYITELRVHLLLVAFSVSEKWYQSLPEQNRALIKKCMQEATRYQWDWVEGENQKCLRMSLEHGMVVNKLTDEDVWEKKARSIWPQFHDVLGGKDKIDRAIAIME